MSQDSFDISFLVSFLGSSSVGKTMLLQHELSNFFMSNRPAGESGSITMEEKMYSINEYRIAVQFMDIPGPERIVKMLRRLVCSSVVLVYVFDVTNSASLDALEERYVEAHASGSVFSVEILVGNKCDLPASERQVTVDQAEAWAKQHSLSYFETSAVTGDGVADCFKYLVSNVLGIVSKYNLEPSFLLEKRIKINRSTLESINM